MSTASFIKGTAAAATLGTVMAGAALFALPAAADVSGYQTGYDYHQGLANGDGSMLMAADTSTGSAAVVADTSGTSVDTSSVQVTPAQVNSESVPAPQAAAPQSTINATDQAAAANPAAASLGYSLAEMIGWIALGIVALLVLAAIWSYATQDRSYRRTRTTTRRTTAYQQ